MKKTVTYCLLFFLLLNASAQQMQKIADSVRKYRNIPGMVYAVFTTDAILDSGASGVRKMRVKNPVRMKNRFQIGATTATFTTYIAARMVQEGKVSWNTTIGKIYPELDGKIVKIYMRITLQQLLGQRAGLPPYDDFNEWRDIHSLPGTPTQQRALFVSMILKRRPTLILDSSKAVYSVAGTAVAAAMLEKISKKSWEQLVEIYINKPLNIKAEFGLPAVKDSTEPWGHWDTYYQLTAHMDDYWAHFFTPIAPAGNINIAMNDYMVYLKDYMLALQNQKSVIGKEAAELLLFQKPGYSLGWYNTIWREMNIAYCTGRGGLYSSYIEIIKEKNIGIIVLCNSGTLDGRAGVTNMGRILRYNYTK